MDNKIKHFYKKVVMIAKNKPYLWGTVVGLNLLILFPSLIWYLYYKGDRGLVIIETSLGVGDALTFYSSVLAAMASMALGFIAVWQNTRLHKLEEDVAAKNSSCNICITKCIDFAPIRLSHDGKSSYEESDIWIQMKMKNYSESFLKKITIRFEEVVFTSYITLAQNETKAIKISLPEGFPANRLPVCRITFTSCYDVDTYGDFQIVMEDDPYNVKIRHYHFYGTTSWI